MRYLKLIITFTLFFSTFLNAQNTIGLDINNDDVEIVGSLDLNSITSYSDGTNYVVDFSYLHTDSKNMTRVAVLAQNSLQGVEALKLSFGLKAVIADKFFAIPFTFQGLYTLPLVDQIPTTSLAFVFSYAPSTLSFSDAQSYSDVSLEADMEIIHNIHLFTGYRNIQTEYEKEKTFNSSFYGGIKLNF
jgi:hypothetical protein